MATPVFSPCRTHTVRVVTKVLEKTGEVKQGRRSDGVLCIQTDRIFDAAFMPENRAFRNQLCIKAAGLGFHGEDKRYLYIVVVSLAGFAGCARADFPAPFHDCVPRPLFKCRVRHRGKNYDVHDF